MWAHQETSKVTCGSHINFPFSRVCVCISSDYSGDTSVFLCMPVPLISMPFPTCQLENAYSFFKANLKPQFLMISTPHPPTTQVDISWKSKQWILPSPAFPAQQWAPTAPWHPPLPNHALHPTNQSWIPPPAHCPSTSPHQHHPCSRPPSSTTHWKFALAFQMVSLPLLLPPFSPLSFLQ